MDEYKNNDPNFYVSLGDLPLNFNVNISSNNLITETEHKFEKKATDGFEHLTTDKFSEIFQEDFEFQDKSNHTPKKSREYLRETARFSNCGNTSNQENLAEKCEFRMNFPSNIRNSIKENICLEADSGEEHSVILNTETYNRPKLNKKLCSSIHNNRFNKEKKVSKNRNMSVVLPDGNNSTSANNSGKLGFEIIPKDEFKINLPKLGSAKNIDTKLIINNKLKNKDNKENTDENPFIELFPTDRKEINENLQDNNKLETDKNNSCNTNHVTNQTNLTPFHAKKKFGSQKEIRELIKIFSPSKKNEQESSMSEVIEQRKSIDFNKRTHFNKDDMTNSNILNKEPNNNSQHSEEDLELECFSEQIMDFRESFKKNADLLKFFSDLRNLKHLEEFIRTKLLKKEEGNDPNEKEEKEKYKEELNKLEEINQELKIKYDKKHREYIEYKSKYDNMAFDNGILERKITELRSQLKSLNEHHNDPNLSSLKSQLKEKEENVAFLQDELASLKENLENSKNEINSLKKDSSKVMKQNELQNKISKLEEENTNLKNKLNLETNHLKDVRKQVELLKESKEELKYENETLNNKYQKLTDENYILKKDLLNYEKELKLKIDNINKLTNDLESYKLRGDKDYPSNYRSKYDSPVKENDNKKAINYHKRKISMDTLQESIAQNKGNNFLTYKNSSLADSSENPNGKKNNSGSTNVQSSISSNFDNSSISSLKHISNDPKQSEKSKKAQIAMNDYLKNEAKIIEIERRLINLQKNKEQVLSELGKMPEFPKQKVQILKKKSLEHNVNEFNAEINTLKTELRGLHTQQKEF